VELNLSANEANLLTDCELEFAHSSIPHGAGGGPTVRFQRAFERSVLRNSGDCGHGLRAKAAQLPDDCGQRVKSG